jgi:hypothetical protein
LSSAEALYFLLKDFELLTGKKAKQVKAGGRREGRFWIEAGNAEPQKFHRRF